MTTELHKAAATGQYHHLVRAIMRGGMDLNAQDELGRTALHIACQHNNPRLVEYLLRRKDVKIMRDKEGKLPVQLAPPEERRKMAVVFSKAEAKRQQKGKGLTQAIQDNQAMKEEADEEKENDYASPMTIRKIFFCLSLPFAVLIFINGVLFALKFVIIALAFYFVMAAFFVSEIAVRPPWYHHKPHATELTRTGCPDYWQCWINDPKTDFNLDYEDVEFDSSDGYVLRGWFVPPPADKVRDMGLVLVHGGGRDRRAWERHLPFLHTAGFGCLLFDLREHGLSDGNMRGFTFGLKERFDVVSAAHVMQSKFHFEKVCVMGTSVGAASVIMAAAIDPSIDAVIAENGITTCATLADQQTVSTLGGYFVHSWYATLMFKAFRRSAAFWLNLRIGNKPSKHCQALHCIDTISPRPVLLMHGTADTIVPMKHSQILYDAAKEPKQLYLCEGAFHCGLYNTRPEEYEEVVLGFLDKYSVINHSGVKKAAEHTAEPGASSTATSAASPEVPLETKKVQ